MSMGTIMHTAMIMTREPQAAALYRLMAWLSPAYPVGAFSYSSGLEWTVEAGDVMSADTLQRWLIVVIEHGGGFCDAVFLVHAHRAVVRSADAAELQGIPLLLRDGHVMEALGRVADHCDERARLLVSTGVCGGGMRVVAWRHHG